MKRVERYEDAIGWLSLLIGCLVAILFVTAGWIGDEKMYVLGLLITYIIGFTTYSIIALTFWAINKLEEGDDRKHMSKKLKKIEDNVKAILEEKKETRGDDYVLYAEYVDRFFPDLRGKSFKELFCQHKELGLPSFESITRLRRKIQERSLALRPTESTRQKRKSAEQDFISYARRR
ncbi:MAG: hypothetical protein K6G85_11225 [Eubacterium sp.]|nr:hypothetical protein [Eubacterium sp.]